MSAFVLKLIASILMVFDNMHNLILSVLHKNIPPIYASHISYIIEVLGRIPMPIFAFFIAEGCRKTENRKRYMLRLLLFALVSEIPYDFALNQLFQPNTRSVWAAATGRSFFWAHDFAQNVGFTLLLGALGIFLYDWLRSRGLRRPLCIVSLVLPAILAEVFKANFGIYGVLLIYAAYFLHERKALQLGAMGAVLTVLYLGYATYWFRSGLNFVYTYANWLMSLAALGLLALYNGKKGMRSMRFFYFVYPVSLAITAILINLLV